MVIFLSNGVIRQHYNVPYPQDVRRSAQAGLHLAVLPCIMFRKVTMNVH